MSEINQIENINQTNNIDSATGLPMKPKRTHTKKPRNSSSTNNSNGNKLTSSSKRLSRKKKNTLESSKKNTENSSKNSDNLSIINQNTQNSQFNVSNSTNLNQQNLSYSISKKGSKALEPISEAPPLQELTKQDGIYEFYINEEGDKNQTVLLFKDNKISTTKYNILTFLPKALLFQFMRLANIYFVVVSVIQCIPLLSPIGPISAIVPLLFVFSVSLIREGYEDYQRGKADQQQNDEEVEVFRGGEWTISHSGNLKMGEIVCVIQDCTFPADLMLLDSNLNDGVCYIETGTLDGEKTLKIKNSPNFTKGKFIKNEANIRSINSIINNNNNNTNINGNVDQNKSIPSPDTNSVQPSMDNNAHATDNGAPHNNPEILNINNKRSSNVSERQGLLLKKPSKNSIQNKYLQDPDKIFVESQKEQDKQKEVQHRDKVDTFSIKGIIQCDMPNPSLYMLNGKANMVLNGIANEFPLDAKNLLLKGAKLRNTEWVIGIVIYTGHNCKIMKNAKEGKIKCSKVELTLNKLLVFILALQIILSIIAIIFHKVYFTRNEDVILPDKTIAEEDYFINTWSDYLELNLPVDSILSFLTYLLLLNTMIPISLIITLEIVKIVQGMFIRYDAKSYSHYRKKFIKANSVSLNEELGMVDYIFSDKTGTLTCNKMNLKFCVIGDQCFEFVRSGIKTPEIEDNRALRDKENIIPFENYDMIKTSILKGSYSSEFESSSGSNNNVSDSQDGENQFESAMMTKSKAKKNHLKKNRIPSKKYDNFVVSSCSNKNNILYLDTSEKLIEEFWKALALCHDCNIQNGEYIGMSPDNLELVKSAQCQGFKFDISPNNEHCVISYVTNPSGPIMNLPILPMVNGKLRRSSISERRESFKKPTGEIVHQKATFEKLCQIEFSSDRKRESILIKEGGIYKLYLKGADSVVEERLGPNNPEEIKKKCKYFVNLFSAEGYRTLFVAMRIFEPEEANDFLDEIETAQKLTTNKKEILDEIYDKIERNLTLIGATIVEDKLQDKVPETIKELREADIKIWMLTGDKLTTAYNIGLSCNLISKKIKTFFVEGKEKQFGKDFKVINEAEREQVIINFDKEFQKFKGEVENGYMKFNKNRTRDNCEDNANNINDINDNKKNAFHTEFDSNIKNSAAELNQNDDDNHLNMEDINDDNDLERNNKSLTFGILVDEKALLTITENEEMAKIFLNIAKSAVAVICCRVSPLQKSQVVKMMQNFAPDKTTLAIGDGGNDVSMIMEAHIGIGIYGEEGLRAAQSSDYAIGEFKVLKRLLFAHGYLNLIRNSDMIIYFFYKNFVFTIIHFFYGFLCDFSGQTIIDDWFITLYNLVFTSIPLGVRGILDITLTEEDGDFIKLLLPFLYKENREYPIFSLVNFSFGLIKGIIHALINYFSCINSLNYDLDDQGHESNLWVISVNLYTNILLIVTFNVMIFTRYHTYINFAIILFFVFFLYPIFLIAVENLSMFNSVGTMKVAFNSPKNWMNILLVTLTCGLIDFGLYAIGTLFTGGVQQNAILLENKNECTAENVMKMPEEIRYKLSKKLTEEEQKKYQAIKEKKLNKNDKEDNINNLNKEKNDNNNNIKVEINMQNNAINKTLVNDNNINNSSNISNKHNKNDNTLNPEDNLRDMLANRGLKSIEVLENSGENNNESDSKKEELTKKKKLRNEESNINGISNSNLLSNAEDSPQLYKRTKTKHKRHTKKKQDGNFVSNTENNNNLNKKVIKDSILAESSNNEGSTKKLNVGGSRKNKGYFKSPTSNTNNIYMMGMNEFNDLRRPIGETELIDNNQNIIPSSTKGISARQTPYVKNHVKNVTDFYSKKY